MKKTILSIVFLAFLTTLSAQSNSNSKYQSGYFKPSTNTYVEPHMKTSTNSTNVDNYSSKGNINPYTGSTGSKAKDYTPAANNYGSGQTINTGSRGGQYYINSNGNKTYVPKRY
jgi:Ni/Co efflux regulator RcnB